MRELKVYEEVDSKGNSPVEIVIGKMLFPEEEDIYNLYLADLRRRDVLSLKANNQDVLLFLQRLADTKNDWSKEGGLDEFRARAKAGFPEIEAELERMTKDSVKDCAQALAASASTPMVDIAKRIKQSVSKGCFAGETLLSTFILKQADLEFGLGRGRHLALKLTNKSRNTGTPLMSKRWAEDAWSKFKSVAHLWAAHLYFERLDKREMPTPYRFVYESPNGQKKSLKPGPLNTLATVGLTDFVNIPPKWTDDHHTLNFLGIALYFYEQGILTKPARSKSNLLDAETTLYVSIDEPLPVITPHLKPPKDLNRLVADYTDI